MYSRIFQSIKNQQPLSKRQYATDAKTKNGNGLLLGGLLAATAVGGYMYTKSPNHNNIIQEKDANKNPMVSEKVSSDPKKPSWESNLEQGSTDNNKDTSRLVGKDTDKVKGVWENKEKEDRATRQVASSVSENNEGQSMWSGWFGGSQKTDNPMVQEKLSSDRTKTDKEMKLEAHANDVIHDTSNLVEKDTKKVEGVWNKSNASHPPHEERKSFWSSLFGSSSKDADTSINQAKSKLNDAKQDTANTAERDANRLSGAWNDTKDALSSEANQVKHDTNAAWEQTKDKAQSNVNSAERQAQSTWNSASAKASDAYNTAQDQGARLKREASDQYANQRDRLSGSLGDLHQTVSDNAGRWKDQGEQKAKSWYEKGTEQVRNGFVSVKDTANQDVKWAEQKVQDGVNTVKHGVFGNKDNDSELKGHILRGERFAEVEEGQLRPTRTQMGRVPAKVVVEHARGSDIHCSHIRPSTKLTTFRSFSCSAKQKEQYLQGYKDSERHHGQYPSRTHYCGDLRATNEGEKVVLCGWAQSSRSLSQDLIFIPIRDHSGVTQLVFRDNNNPQLKSQIQSLSAENVICVEGIVRKRPEGMANEKQATGEIEVEIKTIYCLNPASPSLPFWPGQNQLPNEEVRLRYRYLDLRRDELQRNIRLRSMTANTVRNYLIENGFTEIETPMLFKSTPEGAREFIVPTRRKGNFYALPQSPQQHKQMLMAAGFDRYFQIARCFRDEDLRADRQPEFTQIDLEMSFIKAQDIQSIIEGMITAIWDRALDRKLTKASFPHMTYHEAMSKYGSDKPDTRFDMHINDIGSYVKDAIGDASVDCMVVKKGSLLTGGELKAMQKELELGEDKNFAFVKINENNIHSWPSKCPQLRHSQRIGSIESELNQKLDIEQGDLIMTYKRPDYLYGGNTTMGRIRLYLSNLLRTKGLLQFSSNPYKFLWVESFPLFSPDEAGLRTWQSTHHPFTAPFDQDIPLLGTHPEKVRGQHYDLVLNGMEIGGGSIRIHSPVMQTFILEKVLQLEKHEYQRFDHLIDALGGGCPPHGGIALGFDRLMAILCQASSIRDVIAFPKAAGGKDFVVNSPSEVTTAQLNEYGLKLADQEK
ncbi:hypothetical protein G6F43_002192 [Rhizopus delemar]|nr:hypothetical protein G6F43_002192 [Rhizopus delemar]